VVLFPFRPPRFAHRPVPLLLLARPPLPRPGLPSSSHTINHHLDAHRNRTRLFPSPSFCILLPPPPLFPREFVCVTARPPASPLSAHRPLQKKTSPPLATPSTPSHGPETPHRRETQTNTPTNGASPASSVPPAPAAAAARRRAPYRPARSRQNRTDPPLSCSLSRSLSFENPLLLGTSASRGGGAPRALGIRLQRAPDALPPPGPAAPAPAPLRRPPAAASRLSLLFPSTASSAPPLALFPPHYTTHTHTNTQPASPPPPAQAKS
jgi:hypothetical protein